MSMRSPFLNACNFFGRLQAALPIVDAKRERYGSHGLAAIAGENSQLVSAFTKRSDRIDCVGAKLLGHRDRREAIAMTETDRRCVRIIRCNDVAEFCAAEPRLGAINERAHALSRFFHRAIERLAHDGFARQCDGEWMPARQGKSSGPLQQIGVERSGICDLWFRKR